MGIFNSIKKSRRESSDIDEKIEYLNKELEKTGLREGMTTSGMYFATQENPGIPAVMADVPDSTGVLGSGFTPPIGGNGNANDPSNYPAAYDTAWMYNSNNVDGETNRPIVKTMDQSVIDAYNTAFPDDNRFPSGGAGIVFGNIAFGTGVGYASGGHYKGVLSPGLFGNGSTKIVPPGSAFGAPYFGFGQTYFPATPELANVIMAMSGAYLSLGGYNTDPSKVMTVQLWRQHSTFHDGQWDNWSGKKYTDSETNTRYVLGNFFMYKAANDYVKEPAVPETTTVLYRNDLGDPGFLPINIDLGDLSRQAFDYLKGKADQLFDKGKDIISKFGDFAIDPLGTAANFVKNDLVDFYDKFSDTTLSNDILEPTFEKFGQYIGSKFGFATGVAIAIGTDLSSYLSGKQSEFGDKPAFPSSNNPIAYAVNLAISLAQSIGNGRPVVIDNSVVSSETVAQNISVDDIIMMHETNQTPENGMPYYGTGVDDILNPNKDGEVKKPYMGDGFGYEGGSILTPFFDNKGKLKLINVGDKTLRLGGESGEGFDINTQTFTDIPSGPSGVDIAKSLVESGAFANGLANALNNRPGNNYSADDAAAVTNQVVNDPRYQNLMTVLDNDTIGGSFLQGTGTGAVNGAAGGALFYNQVKVKLGIMPESDLQKAGGYGHVRRETIIDVNDLKPEVKNKLYELYNIQESFSRSVKLKTSLTEEAKLGHFEPEQLNVNIEDLRQGIMPEFPKDPPPEMVNGYSSKSRLAPKKLERSSFIKITKKDLAKNHMLKDSEIKDFMNKINAVNDFIKKHPEELIYAQTRYPKSDPRLAQLNWEMDQKLNASKQYMDKHYPENQKLFTKIQKSIKKNIELTDPKSFKGVKVPKFKGIDLTDFKRRKEVVARHYKKAVKVKKLFSRKKT